MLNRDQIAHEYMQTLLSREATNLFRDEGFCCEVTNDCFDLADAMIAEAQKRKDVERPAVIGDDWIRVEDRLPKQGDIVLVYRPDAHLKTANDPNIKVCQYRGKQHSSYQFDRSIHKVTHWQPLPNPPIQSGDNV